MFKIQSTSAFIVGAEMKLVSMSLECLTAEAAQSSGRAELDEFGLGTGDKCAFAGDFYMLTGVLPDFVCDTSAFTPSVPKLRVLLQSIRWASDSLLVMAFNQLNSGCSSQHLFNLHFPIVVADSSIEVFPELVKCPELTVNLTNTFPQNTTKKGGRRKR